MLSADLPGSGDASLRGGRPSDERGADRSRAPAAGFEGRPAENRLVGSESDRYNRGPVAPLPVPHAMSLSNPDFAYLLLALVHLLVAAHAGGFLFQYFKQPRVIGEILGGLMLGPTVLKAVAPGWYAAVFGAASTLMVLDALNKLGLMLLMFCSGLEIRSEFRSSERKTAAAITVAGTIVPFAFAMSMGAFLDLSSHWGENATELAFNLVIAIAVAVTSIPVISKIMMDLGIMETAFARVVLSAAVVEDILLYVVLSIALALARPDPSATFGLSHWIGVPEGTGWSIAYHVGATLLFFVLALTLGPKVYGRITGTRFNLVRRGSQAGYLMAFLILTTGVALFLEVQLMFGAFLAGVVVAASSESAEEPRRAVRSFSSAFFIPVYFAMVGFKLNLLRDVPWLFFVGFLAVCCAVKAVSVYLGARAAKVGNRGALNLAAAMNARGGPGIVLASVALDAKLINDGFYVCLVLLAIVTSLMAGTWLTRVVRSGAPLL
jgi:Kef-type K+ transport system membrane component KefB